MKNSTFVEVGTFPKRNPVPCQFGEVTVEIIPCLCDYISYSLRKQPRFATLPLVSPQNDVLETSAEIPY